MLLWLRPLARPLSPSALHGQVDRRCARREESQSRGAAAARSGARVPPMRARAPPLGGQAPLVMSTWCRPVVWVTRRGNGGGSKPPQIHGRRHGRSMQRRWAHPWAAPRRSRPRTPSSPHSTSPLDQPTAGPSRPKSRDLKISRHAPNGRRERSTWRRWAHPWAAPRRSRPRTPTSRTRRRHSSQPTSMSSRRKISRPRFFPARTE